MCNVCGCGDSQIEHHHGHNHEHQNGHHHGHSHEHNSGHHHEHNHDHHSHQHGSDQVAKAMVVHHHYHHQGDVHHHVHYHMVESADHHGHHHVEYEHEHEHEHYVSESGKGDLHFGQGEAQVHVAGVSQRQLITLEQDILSQNNHVAEHNREHFVAAQQLVLNLVSSPGSGKTTLLTETLNRLKADVNCAVIEGDQQTSNDADRIRETQVPAIQVNTGKGCHLDADMIHQAYHKLEMNQPGVLFIENVGNLVCPASFDLGERSKVAILSVTEGEDKPLKYPNMFAAADLMIINKVDLLPYVNFDIEACITNARMVNPNIQVLKLSATTGEGVPAWLSWLSEQHAELNSQQ